MTSILVTGSDGLLGWHLRCFLSTMNEVKVVACNRPQFNDANFLAGAVKKIPQHPLIHLRLPGSFVEREFQALRPAQAIERFTKERLDATVEDAYSGA